MMTPRSEKACEGFQDMPAADLEDSSLGHYGGMDDP